MQTLKRSATVLLLALALVACSSDEAKPAKDAGSEDETDAEVEEEADAGSETDTESDAAAQGSADTVPLTVWVDDLIEHRSSDEAEPDTVDDKKISDDTDETSFDKYLP